MTVKKMIERHGPDVVGTNELFVVRIGDSKRIKSE